MIKYLTLTLIFLFLLTATACSTAGDESGTVTPPAESPLASVTEAPLPAPTETVGPLSTETAVPDPTTAPQPTATSGEVLEPTQEAAIDLATRCLPDDPQRTGTGPFINLQDGYCFQYPVEEGFLIKDVLPIGVAAVWGPPLTPSFEPLRAGLTVHKSERAGGRTLHEIVSASPAAYPEAEVVDDDATFAGEAAQVVEGIPGMMDSRRTYLIHDDWVYEITLVPLTQPGELEQAVMAQRDLLWQTVSSSFTWLPEGTAAQFDGCPQAEGSGPNPTSPYVSLSYDYCLLCPSHYQQQESLVQGMTTFTGPALDPTAADPLRAQVRIMAPEQAGGRSVQEVVDDLIVANPASDIEQSEAVLAGKSAILVSGLPGAQEGRDLFAVYDDLVYQIRIEPLGVPELADDLEAAWDMVTTSFTFYR